ncbi:cytochrome c oxidase subunit 3 [Aromatoleum diolicum]|uniref:Cytochrome C oxidase subunit III n=1 Tax=Aromatoleum diolicum TaxID=75796 RepID=A0ABX1QFS1_9RHOO|nr:cytochrome c oxidase subunit 3 [Aromatoleum diolicum]NMG77301.1 cytochrome C oxidase subunit III [Aromatoleum diolicum]
MNLLNALGTRPWLPEPAPPLRTGAVVPAATIGLRVLLAVIAVLFGLFVLALLVRAQLPDWQALAGVPDAALANTAPLWVNTALLALSSVALQAASSASRRGRTAATRLALAGAGLFALAFLAGQGWVWQQFVARGHFVASHPAASFFYLLTGLHGLHLAGGLIAWGRVTIRAWRATPDSPDPGVALCARYWHFLLVVWLVLFALLTSPPGTIATLAEWCGVR